ncbi:MAG TPA: family 43 glycosylhydrolase [Puia sp.]
MKRILCSVALGIATIAHGQQAFNATTSAAHAQTFVNPVLPGDHPDPTLLKVGPDFYHCGSSFHFNPYLPIYHSRDLVHWELIARVIPPSIAAFVEDKPSAGVWQGAITHFYGSYWIYFSAGGQWFCKADKPAGPWSTPERVKTSENIGYDNSIFVDDDGTPYMVMKNGPKYNRLQPIGHDGQLTGKRLNLDWINANGQYSWAEGPVMSKRNGIYYYFMAGSVAGGQYVLKATELTEDSTKWTRLGDFFRPVSDPDNRFPVVNHMSAPIQLDDGSWWTIAQSYERRPNDDWSGMGRQTALYRVTWDGDRPWGEAPVSTPIEAPALPRAGLLHTSAQSDAFDTDSLNLWWHFLNRRAAANISLATRKGWARLTPNSGRTHLVQKETHHYYSTVTCVDLDATDTAAKAGLYLTNGDESVSVRLYSGFDHGKKIVLTIDTAIRSVPNPVGPKIWLKLQRNAHIVTGYFSGDGKEWKSIGAPVNTTTLDKEQPKWNWWVGTSVGLFAEGKPADFDEFTIRDGFSSLPAIGHSDYAGLTTNAPEDYVASANSSGAWFLLSGIEIGKGTSGIEALASASQAGKLEIALDDPDFAKPVAGIPIATTGGAEKWQPFRTRWQGVSGRHDVYIRLPAATPGAIRIRSIRFTR